MERHAKNSKYRTMQKQSTENYKDRNIYRDNNCSFILKKALRPTRSKSFLQEKAHRPYKETYIVQKTKKYKSHGSYDSSASGAV